MAYSGLRGSKRFSAKPAIHYNSGTVSNSPRLAQHNANVASEKHELMSLH